MHKADVEVPDQVRSFIKTHTAIPDGLDSHSLPRFAHRKVGAFLWDRVFSWIGFPHIKRVKESDSVYRLDFVIFGLRTHFIRFTPFRAFALGFAIFAIHRTAPSAFDGHLCMGLFDGGSEDAYIPGWAVKDVLKNLTFICQQHDKEIAFLREEMERIAAAVVEPTETTNSPLMH